MKSRRGERLNVLSSVSVNTLVCGACCCNTLATVLSVCLYVHMHTCVQHDPVDSELLRGTQLVSSGESKRVHERNVNYCITGWPTVKCTYSSRRRSSTTSRNAEGKCETKSPGRRRCVGIIRSGWLNEELRVNELRIDRRTRRPAARQIAPLFALPMTSNILQSSLSCSRQWNDPLCCRCSFSGDILSTDGRLEGFKQARGPVSVLRIRSIFFLGLENNGHLTGMTMLLTDRRWMDRNKYSVTRVSPISVGKRL